MRFRMRLPKSGRPNQSDRWTPAEVARCEMGGRGLSRLHALGMDDGIPDRLDRVRRLGNAPYVGGDDYRANTGASGAQTAATASQSPLSEASTTLGEPSPRGPSGDSEAGAP